jgi:hypothetical protein
MHAALIALSIAAIGCRYRFDERSDARGTGDGDGGVPDVLVVQPITSNIVFVTSTEHVPGALGSRDAADAICNQRASEASLPGTYVAWLSTSSSNAIDRLAGARGWQRPDGRPVVDTVADLMAVRMFYPPELDERGQLVPRRTRLLTGTDGTGLVTVGNTCGDYADTAGNDWSGITGTTTALWTIGGGGTSTGCAEPSRLYCFGIDANIAVAPQPQTARRAFLSVGGFASGSGIGPADTLCAQEASTTGLTGTYRALIATTTASAISRFNLQGPNWTRVDGVELAASPADLAAGLFITSPVVQADGSHWPWGIVGPWTGASQPDAVGTDATTCRDWAMTNMTSTGGVGYYAMAGAEAFSSGTRNCTGAVYVYCLEQ